MSTSVSGVPGRSGSRPCRLRLGTGIADLQRISDLFRSPPSTVEELIPGNTETQKTYPCASADALNAAAGTWQGTFNL